MRENANADIGWPFLPFFVWNRKFLGKSLNLNLSNVERPVQTARLAGPFEENRKAFFKALLLRVNLHKSGNRAGRAVHALLSVSLLFQCFYPAGAKACAGCVAQHGDLVVKCDLY